MSDFPLSDSRAHYPAQLASQLTQLSQLEAVLDPLMGFIQTPNEVPRIELVRKALSSLWQTPNLPQQLIELTSKIKKQQQRLATSPLTIGLTGDTIKSTRHICLAFAELPPPIRELLSAPLSDEIHLEITPTLANSTAQIYFRSEADFLPLIQRYYEQLDLGIRPGSIVGFLKQFSAWTPNVTRHKTQKMAYDALKFLHETAEFWRPLLGQSPQTVAVDALANYLSPTLPKTAIYPIEAIHLPVHATVNEAGVNLRLLAGLERASHDDLYGLQALFVATESPKSSNKIKDLQASFPQIWIGEFPLPLVSPTALLTQMTHALTAYDAGQMQQLQSLHAQFVDQFTALNEQTVTQLEHAKQCVDLQRELAELHQQLRTTLVDQIQPFYDHFYRKLQDESSANYFREVVLKATNAAKSQSPIPPAGALFDYAKAQGSWQPVIAESQTQLRRALTQTLAQELNHYFAELTAELHGELANGLLSPLLANEPKDGKGLTHLAAQLDPVSLPKLSALIRRMAYFQLTYDEHFYYRLRDQLNSLDARDAESALEFEPLHAEAIELEDAEQLFDGLNSHYREAIYRVRTRLENEMAFDGINLIFALVECFCDALESDTTLSVEWPILFSQYGASIWPAIYTEMQAIQTWSDQCECLLKDLRDLPSFTVLTT